MFPSPGDLPNPAIKPRSPALRVEALPAEPPEKPKNTGVGSLSLLQWIFPTQELNQGLLHCRLILDQLSYQGSSPFSPFLCATLVIHIVSNRLGVYSVTMLALYNLASFSKLSRKSNLYSPVFVFSYILTLSSALPFFFCFCITV